MQVDRDIMKLLGPVENTIRDLEAIDKLIPREAGRVGCLMRDKTAAAIIEGRKRELLCYIQDIVRDNVYWLRKAMGDVNKRSS
jgi:hypothetical protein